MAGERVVNVGAALPAALERAEDLVIGTRVRGDAANRLEIRADGTIVRGDGLTAPLMKVASRSDTTPQPKATIAYIGDSHVARAANLPGSRLGMGFLTWVQLLCHERVDAVVNAGVAGVGVETIESNYHSMVAPLKPGFLVYVGGINDIKGSPPRTAAIIQPYISRVLDAAVRDGTHVILLTVPPSDLVDTVGEKTELAALNEWICAQPFSRNGVSAVDIYGAVSSQASILDSGALAWGVGLSDDQTHSNANGAFRMGRLVADQVNLLVPRHSRLPRSTADPGELIANPFMAGNTSGLATGAIHATYSGTPATVSKVPRTDDLVGQGGWQQVAMAANSSTKIQQNVTTGFVAGDRLVATIEIQEDAGTYADVHGLVVELWSSTALLTSISVSSLGSQRVADGVARSEPFVVPSGTASVRLYWRVTSGATPPVWRIGRMSVRKA